MLSIFSLSLLFLISLQINLNQSTDNYIKISVPEMTMQSIITRLTGDVTSDISKISLDSNDINEGVDSSLFKVGGNITFKTLSMDGVKISLTDGKVSITVSNLNAQSNSFKVVKPCEGSANMELKNYNIKIVTGFPGIKDCKLQILDAKPAVSFIDSSKSKLNFNYNPKNVICKATNWVLDKSGIEKMVLNFINKEIPKQFDKTFTKVVNQKKSQFDIDPLSGVAIQLYQNDYLRLCFTKIDIETDSNKNQAISVYVNTSFKKQSNYTTTVSSTKIIVSESSKSSGFKPFTKFSDSLKEKKSTFVDLLKKFSEKTKNIFGNLKNIIGKKIFF